MTDKWLECEQHEWVEKVDSQFSNEHQVDVYCVRCKCPGEKDLKTGKVFWPTT